MPYLLRYGDIEFGSHFKKWPSPRYSQFLKFPPSRILKPYVYITKINSQTFLTTKCLRAYRAGQGLRVGQNEVSGKTVLEPVLWSTKRPTQTTIDCVSDVTTCATYILSNYNLSTVYSRNYVFNARMQFGRHSCEAPTCRQNQRIRWQKLVTYMHVNITKGLHCLDTLLCCLTYTTCKLMVPVLVFVCVFVETWSLQKQFHLHCVE